MENEGRWTGGEQAEIVVVAVGYSQSHVELPRDRGWGSVRHVRLGVGEWVELLARAKG
jgi:hypothetical protein